MLNKDIEKHDKYKIVFDFAKHFLEEIISNNSNLNNSILMQHLQPKPKFENLMDAHRRLIESLANRNMMASVIGFNKREKEMRKILFDYDSNKIINAYNNANELLAVLKLEFNLKGTQNKRSLWRIFSKGIISGSKFMRLFKNKKDFDEFVNTFSRNKYTKAALPMLLSKEIIGYGFALACDFLKELGYRDYPKPDRHLIKIFYELKLSESSNQYDVYKSIIEMTEVVGNDAYTIDKMFWLISSGNFYIVNIDIGRNRELFIRKAKLELK